MGRADEHPVCSFDPATRWSPGRSGERRRAPANGPSFLVDRGLIGRCLLLDEIAAYCAAHAAAIELAAAPQTIDGGEAVMSDPRPVEAVQRWLW